jgi:hypothetical protein
LHEQFPEASNDLLQTENPGTPTYAEAPMVVDLKEFAKQQFKAAQQPVAWLLSAERLRAAGDAILRHELQAELPYLQAHRIAQEEAIADAYREGNDAGLAEIKAIPPNYPPAQLMYAYAIENVLKGLIISKRPDLIQERELDTELATHNLIKLAEKAEFTVQVQEWPVLEALSQLSIWAGRYPVARTRREFVGAPSADELLDYGSSHPIMQMFFDRAYKELERRLPQQIGSRFGSLVVTRQPGT